MPAGRPVPCLLALAALAACSSSPSQPPTSATPGAPPAATDSSGVLPAPGFLRWVPADTPYFYGVLAPPDPGHVEREYVASLAGYEKLLPAVQKLERERPAALRRLSFKTRMAVALLAEAGGRATRPALAAIGMDPVTVGGIYAVGVAPVVRVKLSDPPKFEAALERIADRVGAARATLGARVYYTGKDDVVVWLMAVVDGDLVIGILPADRRDEQAAAVLAEAPPARSLATDRRLETLAATYGFGPAGIGFADLAALTSAVGSTLPAACADELRGFADAVPRVLVGVTRATGQEMRVRSVVEMRADLAAALRDLRGEVPRPELSAATPPQLEIAVALDVGALVRGVGAALARVRSSPLRCPALASLNDLARTQGKTLRQIGKALAGVRGASLSVRNIEGLTLGKADLFFLFGTDRPGDLLDRLAVAMGTRRPKLRPGDPPVELKVPLSSLGAVYGGVAPRAAGLSVGAEPAELTEMLSADAVDDPPMFFFRIDPAAVAQLRALIAGAEPDADPRMAAADPDLARQLADLDGSDLDRFAEGVTTARATQRGLEIDFVGRYPP